MGERAYEIIGDTDDREAWLEARSQGIGASEIGAACGENKWMSPYALWALKVGLLPGRDESEPMTWGKLLEPIIIDEYGRRAGRGVQRHGKLLRSVEYPWALATLDGITWAENDNRDNGWPLEVKTASAYVADDWDDGPPLSYYLQVQQQLLVTGQSRATSVCLLGGQRMVWCDVDRDETAIRRIITIGSEMWGRVLRKDPPPVDGSESTADALAKIYPGDNGKAVLLPFDFLDIADELEGAKKDKKQATARIDTLEAMIKEKLGHSECGALPDGRVFTWSTQTRGEYVAKATTFRVLRMKDPHKKGRAA